MAVFVALGAFLMTLAGGWTAQRVTDRRHLVLGLAGGLMLGVVGLDLLPEALRAADDEIHGVPAALLLFVAGFLLAHLVERLLAARRAAHGAVEHTAVRDEPVRYEAVQYGPVERATVRHEPVPPEAVEGAAAEQGPVRRGVAEHVAVPREGIEGAAAEHGAAEHTAVPREGIEGAAAEHGAAEHTAVPYGAVEGAAAEQGPVRHAAAEHTAVPHDAVDRDAAEHRHRSPEVGLTAAAAMVGHSLMDGVAIGASFQVGGGMGTAVALAVIAHDFADGFNTFTLTRLYGNARRKALAMLFADAVAPVAGAAASAFLAIPENVLGGYLGLFGGALLYLAAAEILPEAHHAHPARSTLLCTVAGVAFIWLVVGVTG
ncbi:ZIP family metal transporter [Streptomyces sp. CSDS2]|uniref:ZIP family metal transporter n=1 Tax=Streptomyces sp. CSDS2 TaxID=3055051 RepID=UPI0025B25756|nr:ZIP family metal transporter [Streptomyces sp. CSDS2]MDN3264897.1 ZIP family metal transporter [Streptomyces sp. CSDS2]